MPLPECSRQVQSARRQSYEGKLYNERVSKAERERTCVWATAASEENDRNLVRYHTKEILERKRRWFCTESRVDVAVAGSLKQEREGEEGGEKGRGCLFATGWRMVRYAAAPGQPETWRL